MKYKYYYLGILVLVLLECSGIAFISVWRESFWQSVENKQLHSFFNMLGLFSIVALLLCFISGYTTYLISYLSLLIRTDLTEKALSKDHHLIEGGEQRVQEDCHNYPFYLLNILVGLSRNIIVFVTFCVIIVLQVGPIYLILPIIYTLIGTGCAAKLAKPLINLNYQNQNVEAAFRRWVLRMGSIVIEKPLKLYESYKAVFDNNKQLYVATKKLSYFQSFYNQITVIVPYLLLFSVYFSGKITFGIFMQVAASVAGIIDSMSYLINSFNDINNMLSCRRRLKELKVI